MERARKFLDSLQILGTALIIIGLPLGIFFMSLGGIILVCAWILGGDLKNKFQAFLKNKFALGISSIFVVFLLGSLYSADASEAQRELRNLLPILFFPVVFAGTKQFTKRKLFLLLHLFVISVVMNSFISFYNYYENPDLDYRKIVRFVSHIRLSLMIVFVIHILGFFSIKKSWPYKIASLLIVLWLIYFMSIYESATGILVLVASLFFTSIFLFLRTKKSKLKRIVLPILLGIGCALVFYGVYSYKQYFKAEEFIISELDKQTVNGNPYMQFDNYGTLENGNYVWKYYCEKEIYSAWAMVRNDIAYTIDEVGVLTRYLTSKGIRKDSVGVFSLTQTEINHVQNGVTNYSMVDQNGFTRRMNEIFYEIDRFKAGADPNGSSLIGRLYYWEAALNLIKEHPIIGIGTGSLKVKLEEEYQKINSPLNESSRELIHNQYLTFTVQFGLLGLTWILIMLIRPFLKQSNTHYIAFIFFGIFMLSCVTEDTINTQAGLTFFILFYCLFFVLPENILSSQRLDKS